jgi:hypothetical protein
MSQEEKIKRFKEEIKFKNRTFPPPGIDNSILKIAVDIVEKVVGGDKEEKLNIEERKILEDFGEILIYCYNTYKSIDGNVMARNEKVKNFILGVFRAGKLAGFEVCEELIPKQVSLNDEFYNEDFNGGYNQAIHKFKSLIEEEKKKL